MDVAPSSNRPEISPSQPQNTSPRTSAQLGLLALRLASCGRGLRELIQANLSDSELSELDFLLLCLVESSDGSTQHQKVLSSRMAISPARLSALVESLRQRELIEVHRHPRDRRRQTLSLSELGQEKMAKAATLLRPTADQLATALSDERLHELSGELETLQLRVIDSIKNSPPAKPTDLDSANQHRRAA